MVFLGACHQSEEGIDVRKMMGHKRSPCSVDQSNYNSIASKKQKPDLSISTKVSFSFINYCCLLIELFPFFSFHYGCTQKYLLYPSFIIFLLWNMQWCLFSMETSPNHIGSSYDFKSWIQQAYDYFQFFVSK